MRKSYLFYIGILLIACSQSSSTQQSENSSAISLVNQSHSSTKPGEVMKLVRHEVIDKEGTGMVATTYLLPEGWRVDDRLYWEYQDATVPIRYKSIMQSSDGDMSIQIFPDVRSSWNTGPSGTYGYQPPADFFSGMKYLIETERKGKDIRYTDQKLLYNQRQNTATGHQSGQSGMVKVEYTENGKTYEEEFYGQLEVASMNTPSMMGNMQSVLWGASRLYACKALKGKLDECRKIAQTASYSARLTKSFYNRLAQVIQLLSDQFYAQVYQAGQISKIISQTNDQMIANIDASYHQAQRSADRTNDQFSDYIRGVDRYSDSGTEVQLPSGYDNAWVNDRGEYILTRTAGYDPGRDFNGSWTQLQRQN